MSHTTSARSAPRRTIFVWEIICSSVAESVVSAPATDVGRGGARPPPPPPHAAALELNGRQLPEQLGRLEPGLEQDHLIQVGPLRYRPDGRRLLHARRGEEPRGGEPGEPLPRVGEMLGAVPHVGPQGHVDPLAPRHPGMLTGYATLAKPRRT